MTTHPIFAAVYDTLTGSLERAVLGPRRQTLLAELTGHVLEIGAGTGASLPYYRAALRVVATEPDPAMRSRLAGKRGTCPVPVALAAAVAEALPFATASFDAVVATCVLCTVTDPARALAEAHRVLRPGGRLLVLEHVRGSGRLARWQDRVTPLWSRINAGCHPNRDIEAAIGRAGFTIEHRECFDPMPRWVLARPMLSARAVRTP